VSTLKLSNQRNGIGNGKGGKRYALNDLKETEQKSSLMCSSKKEDAAPKQNKIKIRKKEVMSLNGWALRLEDRKRKHFSL
jgi:hypothetical protein